MFIVLLNSSVKYEYHAFEDLGTWGNYLYLCGNAFVDGCLLPSKGHLEHDLHIHHLPHLRLRWLFFEKIGNIFLHHLVALSSCNTRFEGEK